MSKKNKQGRVDATDNLRISPEQRLNAKFDETSVAKFPVGSPDKMGMRVRDNCAEENIK